MKCAVLLVGVVSLLLLCVVARASIRAYESHPRTYKRERLEKTCDAVISLLAIVIAASLLVVSWQFEKARLPGPVLVLALGMSWFFVVLMFTLYMRFNFVWKFIGEDFSVGGGERENSIVLWWLDAIMVGITVGLGCVCFSMFRTAFNMPTQPSKSTPVIQVECHADASKPTPMPVKPSQSGKPQSNQKKDKQPATQR